MEPFEDIRHAGKSMAIIIRRDYSAEGVNFFTPSSFSQQLAQMHHFAGEKIKPHVHNCVSRNVEYTLEALFIKRGRIRVDLYTQEKEYICSRELEGGDVILLCSGGHGFEVLEELEMIEVKQGPYAGDGDKAQFDDPERR
jgi:mannose-6-phosphate isomerase-like protein (cupin superfamily)